MGTFWRISNYHDLGGEGGRKVGARWHTAGRRIVYMGSSPAAVILEALVHLDGDGSNLPDGYTLLQITIPDEIAVTQIALPSDHDWRDDEEKTRRLGDAWLRSSKSALARVPSAIAPYTWNYLLNPDHPDASRAEITSVLRERFDRRLLRAGGG